MTVHAPELRLHVVVAERAAALVHRRAARAAALQLHGLSQVADIPKCGMQRAMRCWLLGHYFDEACFMSDAVVSKL